MGGEAEGEEAGVDLAEGGEVVAGAEEAGVLRERRSGGAW